MITSQTDIFVPLSFLPCFGPFFTQLEKRVLDRHFPSLEAGYRSPTHGGSSATPSGDTNTWAFFRHKRPREPVALMAQDQRMGLGLEFLHLFTVRSLVSKSCPVHSKVKQETSWRDIWGQIYWIIVCGLSGVSFQFHIHSFYPSRRNYAVIHMPTSANLLAFDLHYCGRTQDQYLWWFQCAILTL